MESIIRMLPIEPALVDRATTETEAFAVLYDHYFPSVYNYVRYRVGDQETTDDVTSQIFEHVYGSLHRYQSAFWRMAVRHRTEPRERYAAHTGKRRWLTLGAVLHHPSRELQPEEAIDHHDTHERLLQAVAFLNDRERDLIALKLASGLNNRQIATVTGLSESNVGVPVSSNAAA